MKGFWDAIAFNHSHKVTHNRSENILHSLQLPFYIASTMKLYASLYTYSVLFVCKQNTVVSSARKIKINPVIALQCIAQLMRPLIMTQMKKAV